MDSSNIANKPEESGRGITKEYHANPRQALCDRIHRKFVENNSIKGFRVAIAISIPIWAIIIWAIKIFFF